MSIIGDGIMLGAGGESAKIVARAPTGSTVTCTTPSGIVLTAKEVSGTWIFSRLKNAGTYTVTAKNGNKTWTKDILIEYVYTAEVYEAVAYGGVLPQGFSSKRTDLATAANSKYAVFAGGAVSSTMYSNVDAFTEELTRATSNLSYSAQLLKGASAGDLMVFGGGCDYMGATDYSYVNAFDINLTRSALTDLSQVKRQHTTTSVGGYAVHAGGYSTYRGGFCNSVDAYNQNGTKTIATSLSSARANGVGVSFGRYGIIAGSRSAVDVYDEDLSKTSIADLSVERSFPGGATAGKYALIAGGSNLSSVDVYDENFTRFSCDDLSVGRNPAYGSLDSFAVFAGGGSTAIDVYDDSLTRTSNLSLSVAQSAAAVVGNKMIVGANSSGETVEAITLESKFL